MPDVNQDPSIELAHDALVEMGWKFFQRDGQWWCHAVTPGGRISESPTGFDTQAEAVQTAFALAFIAARQVPSFGVRLLMIVNRLQAARKAAAEAPNPTPEENEPGSHAYLKGLLTKYGSQKSADSQP